MHPGVIRCGELESEVHFAWTTMVARQPIHPDFTEIGFPGDLRHGELESAVRLARMRMVDREPMKIEFPGNKFSWGFSMGETWIWVQLIKKVITDDPAFIRWSNKDRPDISRESKRSGDLIWFPTFFCNCQSGQIRFQNGISVRYLRIAISWREQAFICWRETNGKRVYRKTPLVVSIGWITEVL